MRKKYSTSINEKFTLDKTKLFCNKTNGFYYKLIINNGKDSNKYYLSDYLKI